MEKRKGTGTTGFIQMAYLSQDPKTMHEADAYVRHILSSQGEDGYLGVYAPGFAVPALG